MSKMSDHALTHDPEDSGPGFVFADASLPARAVETVSVARLLDRLNRIVAEVQGGKRIATYEERRKQYVALNKALTERGSIAPRFRPSLSGGLHRGAGRSVSANLISNDHQVLDLHWLATEGGFDRWRDAQLPTRWRGLFGETLDIEIAARFAGAAGSSQNKAQILGLGRAEQLALRSIQSETTRQAWRRMRETLDPVDAALARAARSQASLRGKEEKWRTAWLALECARFAGLSGAVWYEAITGERIPETTLSNIRRRLPVLLAR